MPFSCIKARFPVHTSTFHILDITYQTPKRLWHVCAWATWPEWWISEPVGKTFPSTCISDRLFQTRVLPVNRLTKRHATLRERKPPPKSYNCAYPAMGIFNGIFTIPLKIPVSRKWSGSASSTSNGYPTPQKFTRINRQLLELSAKFVQLPLSREGKIPSKTQESASQTLIHCCYSHIPPLQKNSSNIGDNFLSYLPSRQTGKGKT